MIIWREGLDYPMRLQAGDILFIAGCMPLDRTRKLRYEHVVIAAESRIINSPNDFLDAPIYGMPESREKEVGKGIQLSNGRYWLSRDWLGQEMGSSETVWNLSSRAPSIDPSIAIQIQVGLAMRQGSFHCRYGEVFRVDPSLSKKIKTNCLGFVCSILEYFDLKILSHRFPVYPSPYSDDDREFPSPGHLAHALKMEPPVPWCAKDSQEAEEYARADVTLDEALREGMVT